MVHTNKMWLKLKTWSQLAHGLPGRLGDITFFLSLNFGLLIAYLLGMSKDSLSLVFIGNTTVTSVMRATRAILYTRWLKILPCTPVEHYENSSKRRRFGTNCFYRCVSVDWIVHTIADFALHVRFSWFSCTKEIDHFSPIGDLLIQIWTSFSETRLAHVPILHRSWIFRFLENSSKYGRVFQKSV